MLPNKLSNRGVIKSAVVLLYGKWNMCFGVGGFVWLWGLFCLFGKGGGREMKWVGAPFHEQKVVGEGLSTFQSLVICNKKKKKKVVSLLFHPGEREMHGQVL